MEMVKPTDKRSIHTYITLYMDYIHLYVLLCLYLSFRLLFTCKLQLNGATIARCFAAWVSECVIVRRNVYRFLCCYFGRCFLLSLIGSVCLSSVLGSAIRFSRFLYMIRSPRTFQVGRIRSLLFSRKKIWLFLLSESRNFSLDLSSLCD